MTRLLVAIVGVLVLPLAVFRAKQAQEVRNLRALQSDESEPEDAWLVESGVLRKLLQEVR